MLAVAWCGCISICTGSGQAGERLYFTGLELFHKMDHEWLPQSMATMKDMIESRKTAGNC